MKKKIFTLLTLLATVCSGAWAADPDLESDYTLVKTATFGDSDAEDIACSGACAYTAYDTGNKKQQALTIATAPTAAAGWIAFQGWTDGSGKGWWNRDGKSLYCYGAGRSAAVFGDDLTTGWLVIFQCSGQATAGLTLTNADGNPDGTFTYQTSEDGTAYICTITAESNAYVGFCGIKNSQGITSISVYKPNTPVTAATYTVKYVDTKGNTLKEDAVVNSFSGANITLSAGDKANITYEDVVYMYSSDDSEGKTVAGDGSTVVTITFDVAPTYACTVTDNLGNILASENVAQGENFTFYVPYYAFKDGKFYQSPSLSSGKLSYGQCTISSISEATEITVTYTEEENSNVVFYSEAEYLTGVFAYEDQYTQIRMSNGKVGLYQEQAAFVNLPAGIYTITAATRAGTTTFYSGAVGSGTEVMTLTSSGVVVSATSDPFVLTEATDIYTSVGSSKDYFDYIIIRKTGEASESITVTDAGFATYVGAYDLDFSASTIKAYSVKVTGKGVATMTQVDNVPAGTPVLLYAEGGATETIPMTAGAAAVANNDLVAGTGVAVATVDGENTNMILNNGSKGAGFYFAAGQTVAANRAYLHFATSLAPEAGARMILSFGETTGIESVKSAESNAQNGVYNIAGQRVAQPSKGLYIVNGKKVVIK